MMLRSPQAANISADTSSLAFQSGSSPMSSIRPPSSSIRPPVWLVLIAFGWLSCCGCSRSFWRSQADFDAYNLLSQKQFDPRWVIPRTSVEPDPRSRFYDVDDRDKPMLPPDDPAASRYMEWVNGMRGYKSWHKFGQSMTVENPQWLANFGVAPDTFHDSYMLSDGVSVGDDPTKLPTESSIRLVPTIENLTLPQAIELASIHSRDYQTQLENLFLSALQLSLDQYQFQVRYLLGTAPTRPTTALPGTSVPSGVLTNSTVPGVSNTLGLTTAGGVSQILPTGGQWIVGLANNTLWLFSGGQQATTSQSLLSYSLVQPLLAGAGRKLFLENLTFSERNVLYNTRLLTRYRRLFFADTVVNTNGGSGSSPSAISGSTGASVANPTVISTNAGATIAAGNTVSSAAAQGGGIFGYLGMLYQLQQVLNQRENVDYLRSQSERLKELLTQMPFRRLNMDALPDGIRFPESLSPKIDYTPETHRLRWKDSDVMSERERDELLALSDDASYQSAIREIYSQLRIGVTTLDYLQVATQLTNSELRERQLRQAYDDEIDQYKFFLGLPVDLQMTIDPSMLKPFELTDPRLKVLDYRLMKFVSRPWQLDMETPAIEPLRFIVDQFADLVRKIGQDGIDVVTNDVKAVRDTMPRRLERLLWDESREVVAARFDRDMLVYDNVRETYFDVAQQVDVWKRQVQNNDLELEDRKTILSRLKDAREDMLQVVQTLRLLQAGLRAELIELVDFTMTLDEATDTALENRLDLMNARARVMDSRRNMEVAANRLEAILNLVAQGNINTPGVGNHPLDFRGAASSFQVGVQMTAPLDQVQVRNAYRQSLVSYQQQRRAYMLLEDQVKYDIRTSWRQLKVNAQNFETTRKILRQAALQLDINVANNLNPKSVTAGQGGTTNLGTTGLNLLNAVSAVLNAQNNLIQIWASYERNRINIYRDMDIMEIDERGVWVDPLYQNMDPPDPPSNSSESDNAIPPQPAPAKNDSAATPRGKRSSFPGIVRLNSTAPVGTAKADVEERRSDRRSGPGGRAGVASSQIRLVSDFDGADEDSGSDGGSGDGDREEGDVPDYGRREGGSRQYAKRRLDE